MVFFSIPVLAPCSCDWRCPSRRAAAQRGRQHPRRADPSLRQPGQRRRPLGEDLPRQLLSLVLSDAGRSRSSTCRCSSSSTPTTRTCGPTATTRPARWVPRLWRRDIKAGHFSPMSHPQVMAAAVHDFADLAEGKPPSRALLRAQIGRPREYFGDTLVSVTGAGSGIGRETAFAFAREGAEVVISDIDEATVKDTAAADRRPRRCRARLCARRVRRRRGRGVRRAGQRRTRRARHRGQQRRHRAGRGTSWTPRPRSSTGCWTSISAVWSTAAGHLAAAWSSAAPAGTSSTCRRWPPTPRCSR